MKEGAREASERWRTRERENACVGEEKVRRMGEIALLSGFSSVWLVA